MNEGVIRDFEKCSHCGLCLAVCPTYQSSRREPMSPRGRLELMRLQEANGWDAVSSSFLDSCLRCGICASTCPTGVPYPKLIRRHINVSFPPSISDTIAQIKESEAAESSDAVRRITLEALLECVSDKIEKERLPSLPDSANSIIIGSAVLDRLMGRSFIETAVERLANVQMFAVRTPLTDMLSLPLIENGLASVAMRIIETIDIHPRLRSLPVYSLDGMLRLNFNNEYLPEPILNFVPRIGEIPTPKALDLSNRIRKIALDRTVVFDNDISVDEWSHRHDLDILEVPEIFRAATAPRNIDRRANDIQRELIAAKDVWFRENKIDAILTRNIYTLSDFRDRAVLY